MFCWSDSVIHLFKVTKDSLQDNTAPWELPGEGTDKDCVE